MTEYEINYLVLQSRTKDLEKIREKMKKLISEMGARVIKEKNYQKRKLAYEIKHELYGFYTVLRFQTENHDIISKLTHELNLIPEVSRFIIVRAEELPPLKTKEEEEKERQAEKVDQKTTIRHEEIDKVIQQQQKQETVDSAADLTETKKKDEKISAVEKAEISSKISSKEEFEESSDDLKEKKQEQEKGLKEEIQKTAPETKQKEELKTEKITSSTEDQDNSTSKEFKKEDGLEELDKKLDEILNI